jgi:ketosteroid isomerase-like protein
MANENNINIVKKAFACFGKGDVDGIIALMIDDVRWEITEVKNDPVTGTRTGKDAVKNLFIQMGQVQQGEAFNPQNFYSDADKVFVQGNYAFKVNATGKSFACDFIQVFTIKNGLISGYREYTDTAKVQEAFG